jgi:tetratricopeptide (TPR) repeat protein
VGDLQGARAALVRLLGTQTGPHFASVIDGLRGYRGRHQLALVSQRLGEPHEAEGLWRQALAECPGFLPARVGLANLLLVQGRWDELERTLAEMEKLPQGDQEASYVRARALFAKRELPAARRLLEEALAKWPDCLPLLEQYSFTLLEEGRDPDLAERMLLQILEQEPGNANAARNLEALRRNLARLARDEDFRR